MLIKRLLGNPQNAAGLLPVGKKLVAQLLASNIPYLRKAFATGSVEVKRVGGLTILTIQGTGCELPFVVGMAFNNGWFYFGLYRRGESYVIRKFEIEGADTIVSDLYSVAFAPFRGYVLGEVGVDDFRAMFSKTTCALVRRGPTFYGDESYIAGTYRWYPDCTLLFMHFQGVDTGAYWRPNQNALYYTQTTAYGKTLELSAVTVTYATRYLAGYLLRTPYSFMFDAVNITAPSDVAVPVDPENPTSEEEKFLTARENAFTIHMPEALYGAYGPAWPLLVEHALPKWYYFSPYCFYLLTITRTPAYYLEKAYLHDTYFFDNNLLPGARDLYPYGHCYISVMLYDALGEFEFIRLRTLEPIGSYSADCLKARTIGHVTFMEDVSNRYCGIMAVVADEAAPMPRGISDIPAELDEQKPVVLVNIIEPGVHTTDVVYEFSISAETAPWFGVDCFLPDNYTPRQRWALQPVYVPVVDRIVFHNTSGVFSCAIDGSDQRRDFQPEAGYFLGDKLTVEGPWLFGHIRTPSFEETRFFVYDFISMETTWLDSSIFAGVTGVAETSVCTAVSQSSYTGAA